MFFGSSISLHGSVRTAPTPGPPIPNSLHLRLHFDEPIASWGANFAGFSFAASASAWPGWAGRPHECKRGSREHGSLGTIITDAIVAEVHRGEAAVPLQSLCQCLPGWAGRPHECKRGSQEHRSLGTIISDSIPEELDRSEAAVLLQSLCQCLAGLGRQATCMQARVSRARQPSHHHHQCHWS